MPKSLLVLACSLMCLTAFTACTDSTAPASGHDKTPDSGMMSDDGVRRGEIPFEDYLAFAKSHCERDDGTTGRSDKLLYSQLLGSGFPSLPFFGDNGGAFVLITESCELYTSQMCILKGECPKLHYSFPYTRTQLNSEQLAQILSQVRALEWHDKIEEGWFSLDFHESFVSLSFEGQQLYISIGYSAAWTSIPEGLTDFYEQEFIDLLVDSVSLHLPFGTYSGVMAEILQNAEEYQTDQVRIMLFEITDINERSNWFDEQTIFDWPLSMPPDGYQPIGIRGEDGDYCIGSSTIVSGSDASALRELVHIVSMQEALLPQPTILVANGDRLFGIQVRETLPFEDESGVIDHRLWEDKIEAQLCENLRH